MLPHSWQTSLPRLTAPQNRPPRIAVLGIGNSLRSDDGAGSLVARRLADSSLIRALDSVLVVDAGHAPENTTGELRRFVPKVVILIDAAEMGEAPGTIRWIGMEEIDGMSASTHTMPLSMLSRYLILELGCEVKVLGIQPHSTGIGELVSPDVLQAVDEIANGLAVLLPEMVTFEHPTLN
jgi:hydrogenase 3 maturation protease